MRRSGPRDLESGATTGSTTSNSDLAWDLLGAVSLFRNNVERYKWYMTSVSTIRFLAILNVTYSLIGTTFLLLAHFPPNEWQIQRLQFFRLGLCILFFSPTALCADLLALRGLRKLKRKYLLPWLVIYALMLGLAFATFVVEIYHSGVRWHLLLLGICTMIVFTRWRHVSIQYKLMALYPEQPTQQIINDLACDVHVAATAAAAGGPPAYDDASKHMPPPPKYEDLEQPPQYDEGMGRMTEATVEKERTMAEISILKARLEVEDGNQELGEEIRRLEAELAALDDKC